MHLSDLGCFCSLLSIGRAMLNAIDVNTEQCNAFVRVHPSGLQCRCSHVWESTIACNRFVHQTVHFLHPSALQCGCSHLSIVRARKPGVELRRRHTHCLFHGLKDVINGFAGSNITNRCIALVLVLVSAHSLFVPGVKDVINCFAD